MLTKLEVFPIQRSGIMPRKNRVKIRIQMFQVHVHVASVTYASVSAQSIVTETNITEYTLIKLQKHGRVSIWARNSSAVPSTIEILQENKRENEPFRGFIVLLIRRYKNLQDGE